MDICVSMQMHVHTHVPAVIEHTAHKWHHSFQWVWLQYFCAWCE